METDAEIKGKAYVHWKSWQEAYSGIVDQRYLDSLTLDKCEKIAFRRTDNVIIAKDGDSVIGFVGFGKYRNDERRRSFCYLYFIAVLRKRHWVSLDADGALRAC